MSSSGSRTRHKTRTCRSPLVYASGASHVRPRDRAQSPESAPPR
ncbi:MAG: hypothetical protein IT336_13700 [Thermomicrobiales bacterium]|nr:hypothetical protein [Thermomicrobiales bacterium]